MGREIPGSTGVTVTFTNPVSYVGFVWGTPDLFNELDVYNGSTLLGSFIGKTDVGPYYFDIHAGWPVVAYSAGGDGGRAA
jgi:hypothetical protein